MNWKMLWVALTLLALVLFPACAAPPGGENTSPTPTREMGGVPHFGRTTSTYGDKTNAEAGEQFIAAYERGEPGSWEYEVTTVEGDPISYRLMYMGEGKRLRLLYDNTRDRFAAREDQRVVEYECKELVENKEQLRLLGCKGDGQVPVLTIP